MFVWERKRVRNFTREFADAYIGALVSLDGEPYDRVRFFNELVATGAVADVDPQSTPKQTDELRAKRWDTYLNKIREFGLGFAESRPGGPASGGRTWHASPIARAYTAKLLTYR